MCNLQVNEMLLQIEFEPFMFVIFNKVSTKKNNYTHKNMQFHFNVELVGIV